MASIEAQTQEHTSATPASHLGQTVDPPGRQQGQANLHSGKSEYRVTLLRIHHPVAQHHR